MSRFMTRPTKRSRGQALVEFSLALVVFVLLVMAVFDFGRAIFTFNGVSQAAREIARTTSVHLGGDDDAELGSSQETNETFVVQRALVPGLTFAWQTDVTCVDGNGVAHAARDPCVAGVDYVKVRVSAPYRPVTPLLNFLGQFTFEGFSTIRIPG